MLLSAVKNKKMKNEEINIGLIPDVETTESAETDAEKEQLDIDLKEIEKLLDSGERDEEESRIKDLLKKLSEDRFQGENFDSIYEKAKILAVQEFAWKK